MVGAPWADRFRNIWLRIWYLLKKLEPHMVGIGRIYSGLITDTNRHAEEKAGSVSSGRYYYYLLSGYCFREYCFLAYNGTGNNGIRWDVKKDCRREQML